MCLFCQQALELDDLGERDIYKISLLEDMIMVKEDGLPSQQQR
jgi:hypothetical protein